MVIIRLIVYAWRMERTSSIYFFACMGDGATRFIRSGFTGSLLKEISTLNFQILLEPRNSWNLRAILKNQQSLEFVYLLTTPTYLPPVQQPAALLTMGLAQRLSFFPMVWSRPRHRMRPRCRRTSPNMAECS